MSYFFQGWKCTTDGKKLGKLKNIKKNLGAAHADIHKHASNKGKSHAGENSQLLLKKERVKYAGKKENMNGHNQKDKEKCMTNQQMSSQSQKEVRDTPQEASSTLASSSTTVKRKRKQKPKSNNKYKGLCTKQGEGGDKMFLESKTLNDQGENLTTSHTKAEMGSNFRKIGVGVKRVAKDPLVAISKKRKKMQGKEKSESLGLKNKMEMNTVTNTNTQAGEKEFPTTKQKRKRKRKNKAVQPRETNARKTEEGAGEDNNSEKPVMSESFERGSNGRQEISRLEKRKRKRKRQIASKPEEIKKIGAGKDDILKREDTEKEGATEVSAKKNDSKMNSKRKRKKNARKISNENNELDRSENPRSNKKLSKGNDTAKEKYEKTKMQGSARNEARRAKRKKKKLMKKEETKSVESDLDVLDFSDEDKGCDANFMSEVNGLVKNLNFSKFHTPNAKGDVEESTESMDTDQKDVKESDSKKSKQRKESTTFDKEKLAQVLEEGKSPSTEPVSLKDSLRQKMEKRLAAAQFR